MRVRQFPLEDTPRPVHKGDQEKEKGVNTVGKPFSLDTVVLEKIDQSCLQPVVSPAPQKSASRPSDAPPIQIWSLNTPPLTPCTSSDDGSPSCPNFQPVPDLRNKTASIATEKDTSQTFRHSDRGEYWRSEESLKLKPASQPFLHSYPSSNVELLVASCPASPPHAYDAVDDYILRVHPESFDRPRYVTAAEIKNWNWSQLRPPRFNTREGYNTPFPP